MRRPPPVERLEREVGYARSVARGLLSDEHLAEDVVQQAWLTLLQKPPPDARRIGAWFQTVSRNLALKGIRTTVRRRRREQAAARSEAEPGAGEVVERSTLLREVADAVTGLDEPYRRTMLLRYYESLPPRSIAAREGVPVATVRSRIQRAHAQLRVRLEGRFEDRRAGFGAALLCLAEGRDPAPAHTIRGGEPEPARAGSFRLESLAHVQWWLAPALLAATLLAVPLLLPVEEGLDVAIDPGRRRATLPEPPPLAGALDRVPDGAPAPAASGRPADAPAWLSADDPALRVEVRRALDGAPTPGVTVQASGPAASGAPAVAVTGDDGVAWIAGVPLGRVAVKSDRGSAGVAEVLGPGVSFVTLEVPLGVTVRGEVVDSDGRPVEGATVWSSGDGPRSAGAAVARTDARGRFVAVDLPPDRRIAARAAGHAASPIRFLGVPVGATIDDARLVLGDRAATLHGRVVGEGGAAHAGAEVRVERLDARVPIDPDGGDAPATPPSRCVSDAGGRFAAEGLPPGRYALTVHAGGFAPHRSVVELRLVALPRTVALARGARVEGRTTDAAGEPLAGVAVTAAGGPGSPESVSGADGRYSLTAVPAGTTLLRASAPAGHAERTTELRDGDVERWDVVLPRGRRLEGRVTAEDGAPRAGLLVRARPASGEAPPPTTTGPDGRFAIEGCAPVLHAVAAFEAGSLVPLAVGEVDLARAAEVVLRAATAGETVHGRVVGPGGRPVAAEVRVSLASEAADEVVLSTRTDADGAFSFRGLPPAAIRVEARSTDHGVVDLGIHQVAPGRPARLGVLTLPCPARLVLSAPADVEVAFVRRSHGPWRPVYLVGGRAELEESPGPFEVGTVQGASARGSLREGESTLVPLNRSGR